MNLLYHCFLTSANPGRYKDAGGFLRNVSAAEHILTLYVGFTRNLLVAQRPNVADLS
jgi:hypothetical protein